MIKPLLILLSLLTFFNILPDKCHSRAWQRIDNCQLINNPFNDGDSFHVRANGRERIFRLYFVDCPETTDHNKAMKARISEQSRDFGLPASRVLEMGKTAAQFTSTLLKNAGSFTAITRWENAQGDSNKKRSYAYIIVNGRGLDEILLEAGFARVLGRPVDIPAHILPPKGLKGYEHRNNLLKIQHRAKRDKKGAWLKS